MSLAYLEQLTHPRAHIQTLIYEQCSLQCTTVQNRVLVDYISELLDTLIKL